MIHPTAIIDSSAQIADDVEIGPFCVIGANVSIAAGSRLQSYVVVGAESNIGKNNCFFPYTVVGADVQDSSGQQHDGSLTIGDDNTLRECCSISKGMSGGKTVIGSGNYIMSYCHFSHDCHIGSHNTIANRSYFGETSQVGDYSTVGGGGLIVSGCRIGSYAMIGGRGIIYSDVPAFVLVAGSVARAHSVHESGMDLARCDEQGKTAIRLAFELFYRQDKTIPESMEAIRQTCAAGDNLAIFIRSLESGERSIIKYGHMNQ